jgi:hypothetical protein
MPEPYLAVNLSSHLARGHSFTNNSPFHKGENYSASRENKTNLKNYENRPEVPNGYL